MRKWFILAMSAVGMTLFMLVGLGDVTREEVPDPFGAAVTPEPGQADEAAVPLVALRAVVSTDADTFAAIRRATERFERERPNVSVDVINVDPEALRDDYRTQTETGEAPDILLYPAEWVRNEAAGGRLLSLDDYITAERQSQWFETVRGAARWNGYLWGVPADWDPYVFVYRSDAAFAPQAERPMRVSDWLKAGGIALTGDAAQDAGYASRLLRGGAAAPASPEEGQEPPAEAADDDGNAADAGTAEADPGEGGGEAAAEATAISEEAPAAEAEAEAEAEADGSERTAGLPEAPIVDSIAAVSSGEAPWALVRLSEAFETLSGEEGGAWLAAAYVADEGAAPGGLPPFAGSSYVVSPSTAHPAEAAEWIRFVTDPASFERDGRVGAYLPVTRSSFGLSASLAAGTPTMLGGAGAWTASPLPLGGGLDATEVRFALRPLMRAIDAAPASYGAPTAAPAYAALP